MTETGKRLRLAKGEKKSPPTGGGRVRTGTHSQLFASFRTGVR